MRQVFIAFYFLIGSINTVKLNNLMEENHEI